MLLAGVAAKCTRGLRRRACARSKLARAHAPRAVLNDSLDDIRRDNRLACKCVEFFVFTVVDLEQIAHSCAGFFGGAFAGG